MQKIFFSLFILGLLITPTFLKATFNDPSFNHEQITLKPPFGWRFADTKDLPEDVCFMIVGKGNSFFSPSINMARESYSGTLKQYLKKVKEINKTKGCEWKDLGVIKTLMGMGSISQVDIHSKWGVQRLMHLIILKEGTIYIVTASALKDEFTSFYKDFFDAFKSLNQEKILRPIDTNFKNAYTQEDSNIRCE